MTIEELRWLLMAINAAPFQNTEELRYKAKALERFAAELDDKAAEETAEE